MDEVRDTRFPGDAPSPPPPPSEVKVRTMRSDLESMAKSGGGLPQFESVKIANLSRGKYPPEPVAVQDKRKSGMAMALVVIAAVAMLGLLGYFAYRIFFAPAAQPVQSGTAPAQGGAQVPVAAPAGSQPPATVLPAQASPFVHISLFKKPADQTLVLTLPTSSTGGMASNAADLQTFDQKISALLAQAKKDAAVIEIVVQTADHKGVPVGDLFAQENAAVLDPQFLAAHFNPDATFFVYQDKNGFSPAYILSLKSGENWLFLKSDVAKLESSPSIPNFFLTNVGALPANGFADGLVGGTAVRTAGSFLYGWYQTDLILSTSQAGFAAAMNRLQP